MRCRLVLLVLLGFASGPRGAPASPSVPASVTVAARQQEVVLDEPTAGVDQSHARIDVADRVGVCPADPLNGEDVY